MTAKPIIEAFFDKPTNTISYLVTDPATRVAAVIDPVLDFDLSSGEVDTASAERILAVAEERGWRIVLVLETHAHADHLSAAPYIKAKTGAQIGIGEHIRDVQKIFRPVFAFDGLKTDGSDFDRLFTDGERFALGTLAVEVMHTPGHTPADLPDWQCSLCGRHAVHAGLRYRARRFSRRRCPSAIPFDPPPAQPAGRHAAVPLP